MGPFSIIDNNLPVLTALLSIGICGNGRDVTVDFPKQTKWTGLLSEMELVPSSHDGFSCSSCNSTPITGPRFTCKICKSYNLCENCFYTKKVHKHSFYRIVEPGKNTIAF